MADLRSGVQQSLSGSHTLERELGGGMSKVFVADEHRLGAQARVEGALARARGGDVDRLNRSNR